MHVRSIKRDTNVHLNTVQSSSNTVNTRPVKALYLLMFCMHKPQKYLKCILIFVR